MLLQSLGVTLESADIATALRESAIVYPIVMTTHLAGMALFGGMILMTDMRLLGLALKSYSITDVVKGLRPWKHLGLTLTAGCGIFLAWAKAAQYLANPYFHLKLTLFLLIIIHSIVFRGSVYRNTEELDRAPMIPTRAKTAAILSIVLWVGVVSAGRLIGYYEPSKDKDKDKTAQALMVAPSQVVP
jgi:hypothetical protein